MVSPEPLPLGEVDLRSKDGEGEDANRSTALSQKAALQMPFPSTAPPVKMRLERSAERDKREIKIIFPLKMRRATRSAFLIVKLLKCFHYKPKPPCKDLRGGFGHRKENNMKKQKISG